MPPPRNGLRSSARGTVLVALQLLLLQWPPLLLRTTSSSAVMAAAAAAAAAASTAPRAPALAEQVVQLRSAAAAQPHSPLPRVQLALALHELNHMLPDGGSRVPEAEREYRTALSLISPHGEHGGAHMHIQGNLGALLLSADRPAEAIAELQAALETGRALEQHLGGGSRSKTQQQEQQEVAQQLGGLLFNLGKALTSVGRLDEADVRYAEAAASSFGHDLGSYGKALAAGRSMTGEAAQQAAQVASITRQHFASQPELHWLSASGAAAALDKASAAAARGQRQQQQQPEPWITTASSMDLVWLHFALHKHHHAAKQYEPAWQYLQVGNAIMAGLVRYDAASDARNLANIKALFRPPWVTSGLDDASAVFVVGMPRSGSTLVEQMLASHSQVYAAGEDTALAPLTPDINRALAAAQPQDQPVLLRHFAGQYLARMRAKVPGHWATSKGSDANTPSSSTSTSTGPAAAAASPARIVDKMLRNLWLVGYIHMLLPHSCIVHVVRHPLDVALSCFAQPFGYSASALAWSWDLGHTAEQLRMAWDLADHWEAQLPGRVHTVFYEQLVAQPEAVAAQLLAACGLAWEPRVLQFQATNRSVQTASMVQVRQPLYQSAVQRWKAYETQLLPLREDLAPLVARYDQLLLQRSTTVSAAGAAGEAVGSDSQTQEQQGEQQQDGKDEL